jgi:plasmid stabilization system protein ParE
VSNPKVIIAPRVEAEFREIYRWWGANRSLEQAKRWQRGIEKAILGLSTNAQLHGLAPENADFPIEVRQLLFGLGRRPTHRVLSPFDRNRSMCLSFGTWLREQSGRTI